MYPQTPGYILTADGYDGCRDLYLGIQCCWIRTQFKISAICYLGSILNREPAYKTYQSVRGPLSRHMSLLYFYVLCLLSIRMWHAVILTFAAAFRMRLPEKGKSGYDRFGISILRAITYVYGLL